MSHVVLITNNCGNTGCGVFKQGYSHLFNKPGGWNKHGGGAKVAKSINVRVTSLEQLSLAEFSGE